MGIHADILRDVKAVVLAQEMREESALRRGHKMGPMDMYVSPEMGGKRTLTVDDETVVIRPARMDDFDYCQSLHRQNMYALIAEHWGWDPMRFHDDFVCSEMMLLESDGLRIGYYRISIVDEHLYIDDLQLDGRWRGRGLGTDLLASFDAVARSKSLGSVRLLVFRDNRALSLYRRQGYVPLADKGAWLVMTKCLA